MIIESARTDWISRSFHNFFFFLSLGYVVADLLFIYSIFNWSANTKCIPRKKIIGKTIIRNNYNIIKANHNFFFRIFVLFSCHESIFFLSSICVQMIVYHFKMMCVVCLFLHLIAIAFCYGYHFNAYHFHFNLFKFHINIQFTCSFCYKFVFSRQHE